MANIGTESNLNHAKFKNKKDLHENYMNKLLKTSHKSKIEPTPYPMIHSEQFERQALTAGNKLVKLIGKLAGHIVDRHGREGLLELLDLDPKIQHLVNWDFLKASSTFIARFDIVPAIDGSFKFCEFNVDSSVGGGEIIEFYRTLLATKNHSKSPYIVLAKYFKGIIESQELQQVLLVDWSTWMKSEQYHSLSYMKNTFQSILPNTAVIVCDETEVLKLVNNKTLIYRVFLKEDIEHDFGLFHKLKAKTQFIFSQFESEILSSKKWLALLHLKVYKKFLNASDQALIEKYLPYACTVTQSNISNILDNKEEYFFKETNSYGGKSILVGEHTERADLQSALLNLKNSYIAQKRIETPNYILAKDFQSKIKQSYKIVYGLYSIFGKSGGILVRVSSISDIVNVSNGNGKVSWSFVSDDIQQADSSCI